MAETIVTYVISYPGTNLAKIGQAKYFVDRFAQLKTGSPVDPEVLYLFRGSGHKRDFHKKFGHLRHHGEFYHYTATGWATCWLLFLRFPATRSKAIIVVGLRLNVLSRSSNYP
jgi:hypothetical protein